MLKVQFMRVANALGIRIGNNKAENYEPNKIDNAVEQAELINDFDKTKIIKFLKTAYELLVAKLPPFQAKK